MAAASVSRRMVSPPRRRVSSAANRKVEIARLTSPRAQKIGLPFSSVIRWAISSARSARRRETWARASARTWIGSAAASFRTAAAAATASST